MKSLIFVSALLTIASTVGGAQEAGKAPKITPPPAPTQATPPPASQVTIPLDLQNKYLKASLRFTNEKAALEQTPLYKDLQSTGNTLNEAVAELRKICTEKYDLNIDQDGTPICIEKPKAPVKPAEKK